MFKGIAIDLDGTLIKQTNSWDVIREKLNLPSVYKGLIREVGYREAKLRELEHWKKVSVKREDVERALAYFELYEGVKELIPELKRRFAIAMVTGAPEIVALEVGKVVGIGEIFCNEIKFDDEGSVKDFVLNVDEENKGKKLREFAKKHGLREREIIAVGDAGNDIPIFRAAGFSIAFNPKSERTAKSATTIVSGDFTSVYKAIIDAQSTEII